MLLLLILAGGSAVATARDVSAPRPDAAVQSATEEPAPDAGSALDGPGEPPPLVRRGRPPSESSDAAADPSVTPVPAGAHIQVPILTYHYIRDNPEPRGGRGWELYVTPDDFARQMAYLRIAGAHTVTTADVTRALRGGPPLPARPVVLTFDDGYADFATTAAPVLERNGLVGTDYVVGGFIGRPNYMTADQILAVAAHGMVIGAHTMHHLPLSTVPIELAATEITGSKRTLELLLGRPVDDFAYPYGSHTPAVVRAVAEAGFRDAVTTDPGNVQFLATRLEMRRTRVGASDTLAGFAHKALLPPPPPALALPPSAPAVSPSAAPSAPPVAPVTGAPATPTGPSHAGSTTILIPVASPSPKP